MPIFEFVSSLIVVVAINAARMRCLRRKKKHGRIERNFERKPSLEDDCFVKSLLELFEFSNNKVLKPRNSAMTD